MGGRVGQASRREQGSTVVRVGIATVVIAVLLALRSSDPGAQHLERTGRPAATGNTHALFPLQPSRVGRCLTDAQGTPFLVHGDAAWSLLVGLGENEADEYLRDRKGRGFNTLIVNLIEHKFAPKAPLNAYGERPFLSNGFSAPNERYFARVDRVLSRAADYGFLVLLAPAYLGYEGGEEGWYVDMQRAGTDELRQYGRFLGARYRGWKNIIWLHGGDYRPPDLDLVTAVVEGIREKAPGALHSYHGARGSAARLATSGASWLFLNNVYTDEHSVVAAVSTEYEASSMPFILVEAQYEDQGADETIVRSQSYQAVLAGSCGQVFGNKHVWQFDASWRRALDSPGARSMTQMRDILERLEWWKMHPAHGLILSGLGTRGSRAAALLSGDRKRAVVFVPSARTLHLDLGLMHGTNVAAEWIDPVSLGRTAPTMVLPLHARRQPFHTPGQNHGGSGDWLLVLSSGS